MLRLLVFVLAFAAGVATHLQVVGEKPIGWSGRVWGVFNAAPPPRELRALVDQGGQLQLIIAPPGTDRARIPPGAKLALARNGSTAGLYRVRAERADADGEAATRLVITAEDGFEKLTYVQRGDEVVFLRAVAHGQLAMFAGLFDGLLVFGAVLAIGLLALRRMNGSRRARPA